MNYAKQAWIDSIKVDYTDKLSAAEAKWLREFNLKQRWSGEDALNRYDNIYTVGHKLEDGWEYTVPDTSNPEAIVSTLEEIALGYVPEEQPEPKQWIKPLVGRYYDRDMKRGYCCLLPKVGGLDAPAVRYRSMLDACYNPHSKRYKSYGAKGIRVCGRWFYSYGAYVHDIGTFVENGILGLIDRTKDFGPDNVEWKAVIYKKKKKVS